MRAIIIIFFILSMFFIPTSSAVSTTAQIIPTSAILVVGDTFVLTIRVSPSQEVDTLAIDLLKWNSNVIECLSVKKGNIFPESLIWIDGDINNAVGKLESLVIGSEYPTTTSGTLCNITFKVKNPGISTISIEEFCAARAGIDLPKTILNCCQITVEGTIPIPQPDPVTNNTTNNTIPPANNTNNTIPPDDTTPPDDTYIPIENETVTPPTNETTDDNDTIIPPSNNQWNIPTTTIIYLLFSVIVISVSAYAVVRHYKNKQEDDDSDIDDMDDFISDAFGGLNDETSGGDKL